MSGETGAMRARARRWAEAHVGRGGVPGVPWSMHRSLGRVRISRFVVTAALVAILADPVAVACA